MSQLIVLFGGLTFLAGLAIIYNPESVFGPIRNNIETAQLYVMAVVLRGVLGVLLISESGISRYPLVVEVLGWLSLLAAAVFMLIGRKRFVQLMSWALSLTRPLGRVGGAIAAAFGVFLVYAFI